MIWIINILSLSCNVFDESSKWRFWLIILNINNTKKKGINNTLTLKNWKEKIEKKKKIKIIIIINKEIISDK